MSIDVLVVLDSSLPNCEAILRGIAQYRSRSARADWELFIDDEAAAEAEPAWITSHPWAGVISRTTTARLVETCGRRRLPLIDLNDCAPFPGVPKIRPDNILVGHLAAEHLYTLGYRQFYFCGYEGQTWSEERLAGFQEALRLLGHLPTPLLTFHGTELAPVDNEHVIDQLADWLSTLPRPGAVLAAHDLRGRQVLAAARRAGLHVPDDLAVLSVDNEEIRCELANPPLSSIDTDMVTVGFLAAQELERRLFGEFTVCHDVRVEPLRVVKRRSTDHLQMPDRAIAAAVELIRREACNGLRVADVLRRISISRGHLERGFRRYLGLTPQGEIRRVQLSQVKQLLTETDLPLRVIAERTGFEHVEYLSVAFKRATGLPPGRFRTRTRAPCRSKQLVLLPKPVCAA